LARETRPGDGNALVDARATEPAPTKSAPDPDLDLDLDLEHEHEPDPDPDADPDSVPDAKTDAPPGWRRRPSRYFRCRQSRERCRA
jgi:hypothetical protein